MSEPRDRPSLKLRFDRPETLQLLRLVADRSGTSMNRVVSEMIERELPILAEGMELELRSTADLLQTFRMPSPEEQAERFAQAEVEHDDPLRSTYVASTTRPVRVGDTVADPVER